jgi:hypothetical protein
VVLPYVVASGVNGDVRASWQPRERCSERYQNGRALSFFKLAGTLARVV